MKYFEKGVSFLLSSMPTIHNNLFLGFITEKVAKIKLKPKGNLIHLFDLGWNRTWICLTSEHKISNISALCRSRPPIQQMTCQQYRWSRVKLCGGISASQGWSPHSLFMFHWSTVLSISDLWLVECNRTKLAGNLEGTQWDVDLCYLHNLCSAADSNCSIFV